MSATQAAASAAPGGGAPPGDDDNIDVETRARLMGWKPEDQYKGPAGGWLDAEAFVAKADADGRVSRERYAVLERRFVSMERALNGKLEEATGVITQMSDQMRKTDERAYKRAKAELEAERDRAIEAGDKAAVRAVDREIADLEGSKPATPAAPKQDAKPQGGQPVHPDAIAWSERNPWYNANPQLHQATLALHNQLNQTNPELTVAENLERVTQSMAAMYPDIVRPRRAAAPRPDPDEDPENPARSAPAAVAGSTSGRAASRPNPRGFDAMPADAKAAFAKYAKQIAAKPGAKPLTKEEYATNYWGQFD